MQQHIAEKQKFTEVCQMCEVFGIVQIAQLAGDQSGEEGESQEKSSQNEKHSADSHGQTEEISETVSHTIDFGFMCLSALIHYLFIISYFLIFRCYTYN